MPKNQSATLVSALISSPEVDSGIITLRNFLAVRPAAPGTFITAASIFDDKRIKMIIFYQFDKCTHHLLRFVSCIMRQNNRYSCNTYHTLQLRRLTFQSVAQRLLLWYWQYSQLIIFSFLTINACQTSLKPIITTLKNIVWISFPSLIIEMINHRINYQ